MKLKLFITTVLLTVLSTVLTAQSPEQTVYVSMGCKAYAYHVNKNCGSLKRCWAEGHVQSTTRKQAISNHRKPCGICLKAEHSAWKAQGLLKH